MHVCMYICLYVYMSVCMYACMYVCVLACMCMRVYMFARGCICMYICMHVVSIGSSASRFCLYVCMYGCLYICLYACMHISQMTPSAVQKVESLKGQIEFLKSQFITYFTVENSYRTDFWEFLSGTNETADTWRIGWWDFSKVSFTVTATHCNILQHTATSHVPLVTSSADILEGQPTTCSTVGTSYIPDFSHFVNLQKRRGSVQRAQLFSNIS